jgi:hypothetical protein
VTRRLVIELDLPDDLLLLHLPEGLKRRLQELLDRQDRGEALSLVERQEAEGLVQVAEVLSLLRRKADRLSSE